MKYLTMREQRASEYHQLLLQAANVLLWLSGLSVNTVVHLVPTLTPAVTHATEQMEQNKSCC